MKTLEKKSHIYYMSVLFVKAFFQKKALYCLTKVTSAAALQTT